MAMIKMEALKQDKSPSTTDISRSALRNQLWANSKEKNIRKKSKDKILRFSTINNLKTVKPNISELTKEKAFQI